MFELVYRYCSMNNSAEVPKSVLLELFLCCSTAAASLHSSVLHAMAHDMPQQQQQQQQLA